MFVERLSDVTHHLHHLRVVKVIDDVLEDVSVGHEAQRPENDHDGDLLLDVRQDRDDAAGRSQTSSRSEIRTK